RQALREVEKRLRNPGTRTGCPARCAGVHACLHGLRVLQLAVSLRQTSLPLKNTFAKFQYFDFILRFSIGNTYVLWRTDYCAPRRRRSAAVAGRGVAAAPARPGPPLPAPCPKECGFVCRGHRAMRHSSREVQ